MTEQEIMTLGDYCERLLQQDQFATVLKLYEQQTVQQMLATAPGEKQKREDLFASFNGVRDLMGLMTTLVSQKDALIRKDELSADADALEQDIDD